MITFLKDFIKKHFIIILLAIVLSINYSSIFDIFNLYFKSDSNKTPLPAKTTSGDDHLFTVTTLWEFNGENEDKPIYLSVLGSVYDVTRGKKHYGKGSGYSFFSGRDASVSFITGEFENFTKESDDVLKLQPSDILSLYNWKKFYDKQYTYKGKLIGRFYDETGAKTDYHLKVDQMIRLAEAEKQEEAKKKDEFPPCNIEWSETAGTKVWCSNRSGGKLRNWIGVPRKYFEPGQKSYRCACVREDHLDSPHFKEYENCNPMADTCYYRLDD